MINETMSGIQHKQVIKSMVKKTTKQPANQLATIRNGPLVKT